MEGELLLPLYLYRFIRLDFVTINLVVILDYTIIILGGNMARKIAYAAMMAALAMIFSYIEALIPFSFGVPGIKLGLANLVVLVGLYFMEQQLVFGILITRIVLSGFLFANLSTLLYSLAGGIVSFGVMLLLKRIKGFSIVGVSIAGGVSHNIAQLVVAAVVVENRYVFSYLPILLTAGMVTGMLIGIVGERVKPYLVKGKN